MRAGRVGSRPVSQAHTESPMTLSYFETRIHLADDTPRGRYPDAAITTTPDRTDGDAPTVGLTTQAAPGRQTTRLEKQAAVIVANTYRRNQAIDAENDYYQKIGVSTELTQWLTIAARAA